MKRLLTTAAVLALCASPAFGQANYGGAVGVWGVNTAANNAPCLIGVTPYVSTCVLPTTGPGGGGGSAPSATDGSAQASGATVSPISGKGTADGKTHAIATDNNGDVNVFGSAGASFTQGTGAAGANSLNVFVGGALSGLNLASNEAQINGVAPLMGNGTSGPGSQRVNIASDNTPFGVKVTDGTNTAAVKPTSTAAAATDPALVVAKSPNDPATKTQAQDSTGADATDTVNHANRVVLPLSAPLSPTGGNPTSTLTLPATTTAYTAGQLIASSATAGSVVVPSFAIGTSAGAAAISRLRLSTNDATSTAWGGQTIVVDLWIAAPTFTNGDRGTWSPATGTGSHLATFSCVMSAEYGDGAYAECAPSAGTFALPKLASGTAIYWTLNDKTGSGVTGASKVFTLTAEDVN